MEWHRRAAIQGSPHAPFNLAVMYERGSGLPQDYAEALKRYHVLLQPGVPQNYIQAHKRLNLAAVGFAASATEKRAPGDQESRHRGEEDDAAVTRGGAEPCARVEAAAAG
ncbi:MAG TPA: hypothetical protein VL742_00815 [Casimicrobiaceae bacterium]|nr:hypothetical protein [Casimicrobiaceae bacterium]